MKLSTATLFALPAMATGYVFSPDVIFSLTAGQPQLSRRARRLFHQGARAEHQAAKQKPIKARGELIIHSLQDAIPFGQMDRFFDQNIFQTPRLSFSASRDLDELSTAALKGRFAPPYEIIETEDQFQLTMDLPGVRPKDCELTLESDGKVLRLSGGRKVKKENSITEARFDQRFSLRRDMDIHHISANLADGVMTITAPKIVPHVPHPRLVDIVSQPPKLLSEASEQNEQKSGGDKAEQALEEKRREMFQVSLDVPGVRAEDCKVTVESEGRLLRVIGARKTLRNNEVVKRQFDRSFNVGKDVDTDHLTVNLADGVMWISAPRKETTLPNSHTIMISSEPILPLKSEDEETNSEIEIENKNENEKEKKQSDDVDDAVVDLDVTES